MVCIACSWVAPLAFKVNLCVISSRALVALVPWTTYSRPMLTSWLFPSGQNWFLLLEYGLKLCPLRRSATLWPGHSGAFSLIAAGRAGSGDGSPSPIHLLSSRMTLTVVQWGFGESGLFRCCGSVPAPPYGFGF